MQRRTSRGLLPRLGALAALSATGTALVLSLAAQHKPPTPSAAAQAQTAARLDASIARATDQALRDGDLELLDSLERLRACRAGQPTPEPQPLTLASAPPRPHPTRP